MKVIVAMKHVESIGHGATTVLESTIEHIGQVQPLVKLKVVALYVLPPCKVASASRKECKLLSKCAKRASMYVIFDSWGFFDCLQLSVTLSELEQLTGAHIEVNLEKADSTNLHT